MNQQRRDFCVGQTVRILPNPGCPGEFIVHGMAPTYYPSRVEGVITDTEAAHQGKTYADHLYRVQFFHKDLLHGWFSAQEMESISRKEQP